MDPKLLDLLEVSINGTLYDIGQVVHHILSEEYVCARLKGRLWFRFDGNKWCQIEEGPYYELSTTIVNVYESFLKDLLVKEVDHQVDKTMYTTSDEAQSIDATIKVLQSSIAKTNAIIDKLKNVNFKETLCKECLYLFYDREFIAGLDRCEHLVAFRDCVYDMKMKEVRNGEKEDMISIYIDSLYEDVDFENDVIASFLGFRKSLLKKRHPKHVFMLNYF